MMSETAPGPVVAMNADELNSFLTEQRTAGWPRSDPAARMFRRSGSSGLRGAVGLLADPQPAVDRHRPRPRVAAVIDAGEQYGRASRRVEIEGDAAVVAPCRAPAPPSRRPPAGHPGAADAAKYHHGGELTHDGRHAWLRITREGHELGFP